MQELQAEYINELLAEFESAGIEAKIIEGYGKWQIGDTLLALVPVGDEGKAALLQVAVARFSDDLYFVNLYTTLVTEATRDTPELRDMLNDFNTACPIGAFGVIGKEVYHKYAILGDSETTVDSLLYETFRALAAINFIISTNFKNITDGFLA
jgi:hypothetical protein